MPDLQSFSTAVGDAAQRVGFDALMARARRRRRRQQVAAVSAGAAAVAGIALAVSLGSGGPGAAPAPGPMRTPPSAPIPEQAIDVRGERIVSDPRAEVVLGVDPEGDVLSVYSTGTYRHRRTAIAVRTHQGHVSVRLADVVIDRVIPVPSGWIALARESGRVVEEFIGLDAVAHPVETRDQLRDPEPGDVLVDFVRQPIRLYRPGDHTAYLVARVPGRGYTPGLVTSSGDLVVQTYGTGVVTDPGGLYRYVHGAWVPEPSPLRAGALPDTFGGSGDHLALTSNDSVAISDDAGHTWRTVATPAHGNDDTQVTITTSGTVVMTAAGAITGGDVFVRVPAGDQAEAVSGPQPFVIEASGNYLYGLFAYGPGYSRLRLETSTDQGRTWHEIPLPGREDEEQHSGGATPTSAPDAGADPCEATNATQREIASTFGDVIDCARTPTAWVLTTQGDASAAGVVGIHVCAGDCTDDAPRSLGDWTFYRTPTAPGTASRLADVDRTRIRFTSGYGEYVFDTATLEFSKPMTPVTP